MNETGTTSPSSRTPSSLTMVAIILTILLALAGSIAAALEILRSSDTRPIETAAQPHLTLPLIAAAYFLLAIAWTIWFARGRGVRALGTIIAATLSVALLVVTGTLAWQALTASRALTVTTVSCEATALKNSGGNPLDTCVESALDTQLTIEGTTGDPTWTPDATTGSFDALPDGAWNARLAVSGHDDTVAVYVLAERDDQWVRIAQLRPYPDEASGHLRWRGTVATAATDTNLKLQFFASENPAVPSAAIRFTVMGCTGQSIRTFDATTCEPLAVSTAFVQEQTPQGVRTWRQPLVHTEGDAVVVTNLEARTYDLSSDYAAVQTATNSTDILIIPTAMDQIEANSVVAPGDSSFPVEITASTGTIDYTVYVFPAGAQFAVAP